MYNFGCIFLKFSSIHTKQFLRKWQQGNKDLIVHPCSPKSTNEVRYQSSIISLRNAMGFGPTLHGRCKHRHTRVQKAIASAQTQKKPASCTKHFGLLKQVGIKTMNLSFIHRKTMNQVAT